MPQTGAQIPLNQFMNRENPLQILFIVLPWSKPHHPTPGRGYLFRYGRIFKKT